MQLHHLDLLTKHNIYISEKQIKHPTFFYSYPSSSIIIFLLISSVLRIIAEKILQQRAKKKFHSWSQRIWSVIWCLSEPEDETNMYYLNSYTSCWKLNLSTTERHTYPQTHYHTVKQQTAHWCNKKHRNINVEMKEYKNANKVKEITRVKDKMRIKRPKLTESGANIQKDEIAYDV